MTHPEDARSQASQDALSAATELERAAAHLRTAASHMTAGEVPRYAAHLLAARGHLLLAGQTLDDLATTHARRSQPDRP